MARIQREGEVHAWLVSLRQSGSQIKRLECHLSDDEHARARRFVRRTDQVRFVATRSALRCILARRLCEFPAHIKFRYGTHGKPTLANVRSGLHFNVSYSGDWAIIALSRDGQLGVDLEKIESDSATLELADLVFSERERGALEAVPLSEFAAAFYKGWCSKEAYVKGVGCGLTVPLRSFDVCLDPHGPYRLLRASSAVDMSAEWTLHHVQVPCGYAGALATEWPFASILVQTFEVAVEE